MILDYAGVAPNPARDKITVRLPREDEAGDRPADRRARRSPSTTLLPARYRLPLLVLDATGMRLGELEGLTLGRRRRAARPLARLAGRREDGHGPLGRSPAGRSSRPCASSWRATTAPPSGGCSRASAATASGRPSRAPAPPPACRRSARTTSATGGSRLLHLGGVPWARIGEHVGQRNLAVTANTYSHVLADEAELDYAELLT